MEASETRRAIDAQRLAAFCDAGFQISRSFIGLRTSEKPHSMECIDISYEDTDGRSNCD
jgi:hypothetical protein